MPLNRLYELGRENERLRAEVERLTRERNYTLTLLNDRRTLLGMPPWTVDDIQKGAPEVVLCLDCGQPTGDEWPICSACGRK